MSACILECGHQPRRSSRMPPASLACHLGHCPLCRQCEPVTRNFLSPGLLILHVSLDQRHVSRNLIAPECCQSQLGGTPWPRHGLQQYQQWSLNAGNKNQDELYTRTDPRRTHWDQGVAYLCQKWQAAAIHACILSPTPPTGGRVSNSR